MQLDLSSPADVLVIHPNRTHTRSNSLTHVPCFEPQRTGPESLSQTMGFRHVLNGQPHLLKLLPNSAEAIFAELEISLHKEVLFYPEADSTLLFITQGTAKITGSETHVLTTGQIAQIPANHNYGISNVGDNDLKILQIKFAETNFSATIEHQLTTQHYSYEGLMVHNEKLLEKVLNNSFFTLCRDEKLKEPQFRQRFLDNVQICSNFFSDMMFLRQATCQDKRYQGMFWEHLSEEFGHQKLLEARKEINAVTDAILHATSSWFCYQMLVLDNIEKAALVHLTLEVGGFYYHSWAKDKLNSQMQSDYFNIHSEADDDHAKMAKELLKDLSSEKYQRIYQVVENGWNMIDAMTSRVGFLTLQGDK